MQNSLEKLKQDTLITIKNSTSIQELEDIRVNTLGKKGALTDILKGVKDLSNEEKPVIGKLANEVKTALFIEIDAKRATLETEALNATLLNNTEDITLPAISFGFGHTHPITQTVKEVSAIFARLGFSVAEGPEVEDDYHNFEALNIPEHHPARDMHDTFYLTAGQVMRTHTSPVQIRVMENTPPPIMTLAPGKVYRCDSDVTHSPVFHQIEGLYVDKDVSFAHLKGTLEFFLKELFGSDLTVRFRPSYFPFTEPSTEVDVQCFKCKGAGCNLCKKTGWIEILGAGMVNRNVFRSVGYDPDTLSGFAFGLGIDRIAMLKFGITDIRLLYENDLRFLKQF